MQDLPQREMPAGAPRGPHRDQDSPTSSGAMGLTGMTAPGFLVQGLYRPLHLCMAMAAWGKDSLKD